jgi:hypothetical protein
MLKLRRGVVASVESEDAHLARLTVKVARDHRAAIAFVALTGPVAAGDEVVVNVEAAELGLGSGGFDVVCANLTRGLDERVSGGAHVMKLNYTPLQHAVVPAEEDLDRLPPPGCPVAVLALHGQLAPAAFALATLADRARVGYVQTAGGALPGALSDTVAELRRREMVADHVTVAPCFGGAHEAITVEGALDAGFERLGWDCALLAPGPGILGSASALGHGGLTALHSAHSALSLRCETVLAPRLSSGDERPRHRGLSHHSQTVLRLLLRPVAVAVPAELGEEARGGLEHAITAGGHDRVDVAVEALERSYLVSGLSAETMGRPLEHDRDFLRSGLAGGAALAAKLRA